MKQEELLYAAILCKINETLNKQGTVEKPNVHTDKEWERNSQKKTIVKG